MNEDKIMTVSEIAEYMNVHRITIYRLLKTGTLPGFKIGRVWRFSLAEVSNWMQKEHAPAQSHTAEVPARLHS